MGLRDKLFGANSDSRFIFFMPLFLCGLLLAVFGGMNFYYDRIALSALFSVSALVLVLIALCL